MNNRDGLNHGILSAVLARANSCPPAHFENHFYAMKEHILRRYGAMERIVHQRIVHPCWGYPYESCSPNCDKCGGTGVWSSTTVALEEWRYGRHVFHRPIIRLYGTEADSVVIDIEGRIAKRVRPGARACCAALFMLYRPSLINMNTTTAGGAEMLRKAVRIACRIGAVSRAAVLPPALGEDIPLQ